MAYIFCGWGYPAAFLYACFSSSATARPVELGSFCTALHIPSGVLFFIFFFILSRYPSRNKLSIKHDHQIEMISPSNHNHDHDDHRTTNQKNPSDLPHRFHSNDSDFNVDLHSGSCLLYVCVCVCVFLFHSYQGRTEMASRKKRNPASKITSRSRDVPPKQGAMLTIVFVFFLRSRPTLRPAGLGSRWTRRRRWWWWSWWTLQLCHKRANERLRQLHQSRAIDPDRGTVAPARGADRGRSRALVHDGTRDAVSILACMWTPLVAFFIFNHFYVQLARRALFRTNPVRTRCRGFASDVISRLRVRMVRATLTDWFRCLAWLCLPWSAVRSLLPTCNELPQEVAVNFQHPSEGFIKRIEPNGYFMVVRACLVF